jgi:hypothetical protein
MIRGVALSVPQVISSLTPAGPSSEGVGEGRSAMREKLFIVGDLERSIMMVIVSARSDEVGKTLHGVPAIAASIRLLVGLGGADELWESEVSFCCASRVFPCLMDFVTPFATVGWLDELGGWYGDTSASGENISEFRVYTKL